MATDHPPTLLGAVETCIGPNTLLDNSMHISHRRLQTVVSTAEGELVASIHALA